MNRFFQPQEKPAAGFFLRIVGDGIMLKMNRLLWCGEKYVTVSEFPSKNGCTFASGKKQKKALTSECVDE
jgi:hypothetical protein